MMKQILFRVFFSVAILGMPFLSAQPGSPLQLRNDQNQQYGTPPQGYTQTQQPYASSQIQWFTNYHQALQTAKKDRKHILLFFTGSDWCGWCKKMQQEIFATPVFSQEVGKDFVFVEIDFPMSKTLPPEQSQQNAQLKQKYGITGYPTVIILDPNENFIAETGYRPGGGKAYADYLLQILQG